MEKRQKKFYSKISDYRTKQEVEKALVKLPGESIPDLDCEEFYNLMQNYRTAPISDQPLVTKCFENVKDYLKKNSK